MNRAPSSTPRSSMARGFTFIELIVTMAILMFILVSAYNVIDTSQRVTANQEEIADMDASARTAVDIMSTEIRETGLSPRGILPPGMTPAVPWLTVVGTVGEAVDIRMDNDGDGDTTSDGEWIRYERRNIVSSVGEIVRITDSDGNGSLTAADKATTMCRYVMRRKNGNPPIFTYLDKNGKSLTTVADIETLTASIRVEFRVRSNFKDRVTKAYREVEVREAVVLRNIHKIPS